MKKIEAHQAAIAILEAIQKFQSAIENTRTRPGNAIFPSVAKHATHKIDIYQRCIVRLQQRYDRLVGELASEGK